jgi:hypothetical protein
MLLRSRTRISYDAGIDYNSHSEDTGASQGTTLPLIEDANRSLIDWAEQVLGGTTVHIGAPGLAPAGVCLYLFEMSPEPVPRGARHSRLQVGLRYLVTVGGEDVNDAHQKLSLLAFAAMEEPRFELEREARPPEFWLALGAPLQPCLVVRTVMTREVPQQPVKTVRKMVLETIVATQLRGAVRGPGDVPIAGALVELRGLDLFSQTDPDGRFSFSLVPETNPPTILRIRAKGQEYLVDMAESDMRAGSVIVRLELED